MNQEMSNWSHKDSWQRRGKNFMVEVYHYTEKLTEESACYDSDRGHRWNVYAYIYPKHPHFAAFVRTEGMWQEAAAMLGFHCGPSFLQFPQYDDVVTCVKVGGDYNHLGDDYYTQAESVEDAWSVFNDAEDLFEKLTRMQANADTTIR